MKLSAALCITIVFFGDLAVARESGLHYYLVQDAVTNEVVRRDTAGSNGFAFNNVFLAPDTRYRAWVLQAETFDVGVIEFQMPGNGRRFLAPDITLLPSSSADSDGDGLHDDGEFIIGTFIDDPDSDDDGLNDGTEVRQGSDPLEGTPARTGIIGTINTPGSAIGVCALNDVVAIADSNQGVAVYNVFNGMQPLLIAQVDTPGVATAAACGTGFIAIADNAAGLTIVDVTDPANAAIQHQVSAEGSIDRVEVEGNLVYALNSRGQSFFVFDTLSGLVLARENLPERLDDISIAGDHLYVLSRSQLYIYDLFSLGLQQRGSVAVAGSVPPLDPGRALFAGTEFIYVGTFNGYAVIDASDADAPVVVTPVTAGAAIHDLVLNGSGTAVTVTSFAGSGTLRPSTYSVDDPANTNDVILSIDTPGVTRNVAIYNGIAYFADSNAGMQVINYEAFDANGVAPTIELDISGDTGEIVAGQLYRVTANVDDDVQVRNVEFYVGGQKVVTDGNYPFEVRLQAPALDGGPLVLRARASDTGGNFVWSEELVAPLVADNVAPFVRQVTPADGRVLGSVTGLVATISEAVSPQSLQSGLVELVEAGPDGIIGNTDDVALPAPQVGFDGASLLLNAIFDSPLAAGSYRASVSDSLTDLSLNPMNAPFVWSFVVFDIGQDRDGDGVPDALEASLGLDPDLADTDGDGTPDGAEDFDSDGLGNADEVLLNFDPTREDSDGNGVIDSLQDSDSDGATDAEEVLQIGSNRFNPDTDGDGVIDGVEIALGSDPNSDLSVPLTATWSQTPLLAGADHQFTIRVSNQSLVNVVTDARIDLTVPEGISFGQFIDTVPDADSSTAYCNGGGATNLSSSLCEPGENLSWSFGDIQPGTSRVITVNATVASSIPLGLISEAQIVFSGSNRQATFVIDAATTDDQVLDAVLSVESNSVVAGDAVRLTLDVSNPGDSDVTGANYVLTLPSDVSGVLPSDGGVFDPSTSTVTWALGDLVPGVRVKRRVMVTTPAAAVDGTVWSIEGALSYGGGNAADVLHHETLLLEDSVLLALLLSTPNDPVAAGESVLLEYRVTNRSAVTSDATVTMWVPKGLSFNEFNDVVPNPSGGTASCNGGGFINTNSSVCEAGEWLQWTLDDVESNETRTISIYGTVDADVANGTLMTVPVRLDLAGSVVTRDLAIAVQQPIALESLLSASADVVALGDSVQFSVDVSNAGDTLVASTSYVLQLPADATGILASDGGSFDPVTDEVTWNLGDFDPGERVQRNVTVTTPVGATDGTVWVVNGELMHDGGDAIDVRHTETVLLASTAPIELLLSTPNDPAAASESVLLEYRVTNRSAVTSDATVTMWVPKGLSFHEFNDVVPNPSGGTASCNGGGFINTNSSVCEAGEWLQWTLDDVESNETRTISIYGTVDADVANGTLMTVPVRLDLAGSVVTRDLAIAVQQPIALESLLSASADVVALGDSVQFSVDVSNAGDTLVASTSYVLQLPADATGILASDGGSFDPVTDEVTWNLGDFDPGERVQRNVTVTTPVGATDGTVWVVNGELMHDGGDAIDVRHTETVLLASTAPIELLLSTPNDPAAASESVLLEYRVTNRSAVTSDATVTMWVPKGLSFHEFNDVVPNPSGGTASCNGGGFINTNSSVCEAGEWLQWTLDDIASSETRTITIYGTVDADVPNGTLMTIPVRLDLAGSSAFNQLAVRVLQELPLQVSLTASQDLISDGASIDLALDLANRGTAPITGTSYSLQLPSGVTSVVPSDSGSYDAGSSIVTWTVGSIAASTRVGRTVAFDMPSVGVGQILQASGKLASSIAGEIDSNNRWIWLVENDPEFDLNVLAAPDVIGANQQFTLSIDVTNSSGVVASPIVTSWIPIGVSFGEFTDTSINPSGGTAVCNGGGFVNTSSSVCDPGEWVQWVLSDMAVDETRTIAITVTADGTVTAGSLQPWLIRVDGANASTSVVETIKFGP